MTYYLILCEIPTYGSTENNLVWTEIRTDLPEEPCPYYYSLLLTSQDRQHLIKYAMLHNYDIEGD